MKHPKPLTKYLLKHKETSQTFVFKIDRIISYDTIRKILNMEAKGIPYKMSKDKAISLWKKTHEVFKDDGLNL